MIEKLMVTAYNINMKRLYNLEQDAKRKEYDNLFFRIQLTNW